MVIDSEIKVIVECSGPVWFIICHHSIFIIQFSSLITHHSSLITHHLKYLNFSNTQLGFTKKKKICLSNIAVRYMGLIMKMSLKTEFWKLKTLKMCFQFS